MTKTSLIKIILPLLAGGFLSSCDFISNKVLSKPVVKVESHELSAQAFSKLLALKLKDFDALAAKDPKIISFFKEEIVADFLINSYVNLWFEENALSVSPKDLDAEIKKTLQAYPSDAAFSEALGEQGISYADWVGSVKLQLKKRQLLSSLAKKSDRPTEAELISYYNSNRANFEQKESVLLTHILVADQNQADIVKSLIKKQNFSDVAKKYSSSYTDANKDYYGWVERDFSPDLDKAFKLRPGDTFGPIMLSDGIHIFKLVEKRPFKLRAFTEVKKQVELEVASLREKARFSAWVDSQVKKYHVKKNTSLLDSVQVETQ